MAGQASQHEVTVALQNVQGGYIRLSELSPLQATVDISTINSQYEAALDMGAESHIWNPLLGTLKKFLATGAPKITKAMLLGPGSFSGVPSELRKQAPQIALYQLVIFEQCVKCILDITPSLTLIVQEPLFNQEDISFLTQLWKKKFPTLRVEIAQSPNAFGEIDQSTFVYEASKEQAIETIVYDRRPAILLGYIIVPHTDGGGSNASGAAVQSQFQQLYQGTKMPNGNSASYEFMAWSNQVLWLKKSPSNSTASSSGPSTSQGTSSNQPRFPAPNSQRASG